MTITTSAARDRQVAEAEAYVRSRFYPPLPYQYGELAVTAVDEYREFGPGAHVNIPAGLPIIPREARHDEDGDLYVTAAELIRILRIEHMVDHDDEE